MARTFVVSVGLIIAVLTWCGVGHAQMNDGSSFQGLGPNGWGQGANGMNGRQGPQMRPPMFGQSQGVRFGASTQGNDASSGWYGQSVTGTQGTSSNGAQNQRPPAGGPGMQGFAIEAVSTTSTSNSGVHLFQLDLGGGPPPQGGAANGSMSLLNVPGQGPQYNGLDMNGGYMNGGFTNGGYGGMNQMARPAGRAMIAGQPCMLIDLVMDGGTSTTSTTSATTTQHTLTARLVANSQNSSVTSTYSTTTSLLTTSTSTTTNLPPGMVVIGEISLTMQQIEGRMVAMGAAIVGSVQYSILATLGPQGPPPNGGAQQGAGTSTTSGY